MGATKSPAPFCHTPGGRPGPAGPEVQHWVHTLSECRLSLGQARAASQLTLVSPLEFSDPTLSLPCGTRDLLHPSTELRRRGNGGVLCRTCHPEWVLEDTRTGS